MFRIKTIRNVCLFLVLCTHTSFAAMEEDKNQPISIQADSVSIENKEGKSIYEGNVIVVQGTTHLTAAKAIVYITQDNDIKEAEAFGKEKIQAHYWTQTDPKKPELNAYADIIRILPKEHLIYLIGHAKVNQGEDSYQAPEIEYNMETQHVFSPKSIKGRTVIVIHPKQKT